MALPSHMAAAWWHQKTSYVPKCAFTSTSRFLCSAMCLAVSTVSTRWPLSVWQCDLVSMHRVACWVSTCGVLTVLCLLPLCRGILKEGAGRTRSGSNSTSAGGAGSRSSVKSSQREAGRPSAQPLSSGTQLAA